MTNFKHGRRWALVAAAAVAVMAASCSKKADTAAAPAAPAASAAKTEFTIGWTIYAGWMPWKYANDHGIVKSGPTNTASRSIWCRSTTIPKA